MKNLSRVAVLLSISTGFAMTSCKWGAERRVENTEMGEARFGDYDVDHDGFLSEDEFRRYKPDFTENFETIDVDRDQRVNEGEFQRFGQRPD